MPLGTGPQVFWKLKFDKPKYIDHIVVWNRMDYRPNRIDGLRLFVGGDLVKTFEYTCPRQVILQTRKSEDSDPVFML